METKNINISRVFLLIWGLTGFLYGTWGLLADWQFYKHGIEVPAKVVDHTNGGKYDRAILEYFVDGKSYRLVSLYDHTTGDTEVLRYNSQNPNEARENSHLPFDALWIILGVIALSIQKYLKHVLKSRELEPIPELPYDQSDKAKAPSNEDEIPRDIYDK